MFNDIKKPAYQYAGFFIAVLILRKDNGSLLADQMIL